MPDTQKIIDKFTEAYVKVYGSQPIIESKGGWHKINGERSVRLAEMESMTRSLVHRKPVKSKSKTEKSGSAPIKKAISKPRRKASASTQSHTTPAFKKRKTNLNQGFNVIKTGNGLRPFEYWADQIQQQHTHPSYPRGTLRKT